MNPTKIEGEMKVRIELWGRGGEISACPLTKEQYLHWHKEKKKDDDQFESMVTGFADDESGVGDDIKVLYWTEING